MNKYILIIIPPDNLIEFVDKYRKEYAKYTNYIIPPHVTIHSPFYIKNSNEEEIIQILKNTLRAKPFEITFLSVNFFENKKSVAYFEPDKKSSERLRGIFIKLDKILKEKTTQVSKDYNFTPQEFIFHMTIADDIPSEVFPKDKNKLSQIKVNFSFNVTSLYLYKQEKDSVVWEKLKKISF